MAKAPSESRIPTFGSRIPIPGKFRFLSAAPPTVTGNSKIVYTKTPADQHALLSVTITRDPPEDGDATITVEEEHQEVEGDRTLVEVERSPLSADIGKRVRVGRVMSGTLRYVGGVQFNAGMWCGVELDEAVGKHDGCVNGIRYFSCRPGCGLLAPIDKVALTDRAEETSSLLTVDVGAEQGLVLEANPAPAETTTKSAHKRRISEQRDHEHPKNRKHSLPIDITFAPEKHQATFIKEDNANATYCLDTSEGNSHNETYDVQSSDTFSYPLTQSTPLITKERKRNLNLTQVLNSESSPVSTPSIVKQNSFELDDSLGILTPDQMLEFSTFIEHSKTPSSEDLKSLLSSRRSDKTISNSRTPSSENLGSLPQDVVKSVTPFPMETEELVVVRTEYLHPQRPDAIELKNPIEVSHKVTKMLGVHGELPSPSMLENSVIEFSLGLIDEDMLASANQFSSNLDTTTNLDLPLDSLHADEKNVFKSLSRSDQTPSPEDLPLDPIDSIKNEIDMLEPVLSNPSTESDAKTDTSKSTTNTKTSSFVTSVTSITSLDTGYQGDGEMSRPASRGADHSPVAHKPSNPLAVVQWQRPVPRRPDPMTDSDFFTESDADNHEENAPKGDRKAQVIDGTLYGANAQAAAPAYIGNHEEMDSSGIFTDLDTNPRTDDYSDGERHKMEVVHDDKSPSDISTKTISENSQEINCTKELDATIILNTMSIPLTEEPPNPQDSDMKSPTLSVISAGSKKNCRTRTPLPKDENPTKKFKMPKRNVASKVKTMLETTKTNELDTTTEVRKTTRKSVNRWDAVMNKISKGQEETKTKGRLKEVKSKVATGIADSAAPPAAAKRLDGRKAVLENSSVTKSKIRRIRARPDNILPGNKSAGRATSSIHSSLSDVSVGPKATVQRAVVSRVVKKRDPGRCGTPVTEVLTASGPKPAPVVSAPRTAVAPQAQQPRTVTREPAKKSGVGSVAADAKAPLVRRTPSRRTVGATPPHKPPAIKDQSRVTGAPPLKGGSPARSQATPVERTPAPPPALPQLRHSAKGVEALGVLVQYLVFNLDAFRGPSLKRELDRTKSQWLKDKLDLEEMQMGYRRLEDDLADQKILTVRSVEAERVRYRAEIAELFEKHRRDIGVLTENYAQEKLNLERHFQEESNILRAQLDAEFSDRESEIQSRVDASSVEHRARIRDLEQQAEHMRQEHRATVEILREENESVRASMDERVGGLVQELDDERRRNEGLRGQMVERERRAEELLAAAHDEISVLKEENKKILETFKSDTKDNKLQAALGRCTQLQDEVESLRTVLDLKLAELSELRRAHGELIQAAEELPAALVRIQSLQARVEDLELQLERKSDYENQLSKENKRLLESYNQELKQKKRLSLHNEELQWKLKQNSEVVNAILGQAPSRKSFHDSNQSLCDDISYKTPCTGFLNRSLHTSSFNEKHHSTPHMLERTLSFRERTSSFLRETLCKKSEFINDRSSSKSDYFELDDSPPSSPKVKGVVEKSDSVSWVLDMDESPEVMASRMVRRAGSFRNVTPPKSTPTKSPATKRPRTKSNNNLSLSSSAGAIVGPDNKNDNRFRSKSVSLRDSQSPESYHPGEYLSNSWHYSLRTSTPTKVGLETIRSGVKLENNPDLEHDSDAAISLPALPSEISRKGDAGKPEGLPSLPSGDLLILQASFPKNSAGEALISESNSEDECSSSTSERSPSVSDTETSEEPNGPGDKCSEKHTKMQYDLYLMTESTTNSEAMDYSWSEEIDA